MSDIIRLLPERVTNQIAAGEVVQRPASVVKELMENAIDAKASKIELIIQEAGKNLIQVIDDGQGMSAQDAKKAFERHATSKITCTEDIFNIHTKGFRGEALAAIAAIAQVELKTKEKDNSVGTCVSIEGGEVKAQEPVQTFLGSSFKVKNLFFNVPARRKFLKSNPVEFRHIIDEFQRVALAHEEIEFDLFHNKETIFRLRKANLTQRIIDIFGRKLQPLLVPIKEELDWVTLRGYVSKPEGAKKTRGEQFFFVNKRFFRSPYFNKAVQEAFDGLLMPGYMPSFFLFLEIDPKKIDINIHPQKTEVKFEDEPLIFALIRTTIKKSLGIYNVSASLDFSKNPKMGVFLQNTKQSINFQKIEVPKSFNPFKGDTRAGTQEIISLSDMYAQHVQTQPSKINLFEQEEGLEEDLMRLPNGYWVYNKGEIVLILDPGRMNSVLEEKNSAIKKNKKPTCQTLLYSLEYHLNEIEKTKYNAIKDYLPGMGFDIQIIDNILRINAIPEGLKESQAIRLLEKLFGILRDQSEEEFLNDYGYHLKKITTKSRFDFIYKHEIVSLIKEFSKIGFPNYTSSGKKCFIELPLEDLKNKF
ncbi:MAG: DNA mismatch repair endonuclease MutL [Bergeyella sp.]|nr:DNA mismatch repair endonuclease MutL [Bergeyella sp.]